MMFKSIFLLRGSRACSNIERKSFLLQILTKPILQERRRVIKKVPLVFAVINTFCSHFLEVAKIEDKVTSWLFCKWSFPPCLELGLEDHLLESNA